ncbi:MAG TPA: DUF1634 domain-containing protein [Limnochordia bacterium]
MDTNRKKGTIGVIASAPDGALLARASTAQGRLERRIGAVLRIGTALAGALLVFALVTAWLPGSGENPAAGAAPTGRLSLSGEPLNRWSLIGLAVLIATPVARVAIAAWTYLEQDERALAGISIAVLALLLGGFLLGAVH